MCISLNYYALVHSHITYLLRVFSTSASKSELDKLQIAQNVAIRSIFWCEYRVVRWRTIEIFNKFNILNVKLLCDYNLGLLMYKREHKPMKINMISRSEHNYTTRFRYNIATMNYLLVY